MREAEVGNGIFERIREVRRVVGRRRRWLAAGLAAAAVAAGISAAAPEPPSRVAVFAASHDLAAGHRLQPKDLTTVRLRAGAVPDGALRPGRHLAGRLLAGPLRAGEPLTDVRLLGPSLLAHVGTPGLVAAPVRLADRAASSLLHPGDRVDVLATDPDVATQETHPSSGRVDAPSGATARHGADEPAAQATSPAEVVAQGLQVLTVPPAQTDAAGGALVVLAARRDVAAKLAAAGVRARLTVTIQPRK